MSGLTKSNLDIPFTQGLDTKTSAKRVKPGKFISLVNSVFTDEDLTKRNGYAPLPTLPDLYTTTLGTFGGSLTAVGRRLYNYSPETATWHDKGAITQVSTDTTPLVRSATSQTQQDVAVTSEGLSCAVWADSDGTTKYQVNDTHSSQIIVSATSLPSTATQARVFILGSNFIITFLATVGGATHLQYIAVPIFDPASPGTATDMGTSALQVASLTAGYDGYVFDNNRLYVAWHFNNGADAIKITYLTSSLSIGAATTLASQKANYVSVTADLSAALPTIWVTWYDKVALVGSSAALDYNLAQVLAPTPTSSLTNIVGITSAADADTLVVFYQRSSTYNISSIRSDYIASSFCTIAGSSGYRPNVARSVGLASKAFVVDGVTYMMVAYGGAYQPTYFLMDASGNLIAKLAYSNGGGYVGSQVLPSATVSGSTVQIGYLFKDLLTSVNKSQGVANVSGIYSQTGINLVTWGINDGVMSTDEIGNNLHLGGGFMWMYDGARPVEHGFHVYPEDIVNITSTGVTPTADTTNGSPIITNISSVVWGVGAGCTITGTGIPANTTILSVSGNTAVLSNNATASGVGTLMTIKGNLIAQQYFYVAVYEWTDAQGNIHRSAPSVPKGQLTTTTTSSNTLLVPTLRLTAKTGASKVRIVIYRWSTAQQNYYQITSIASPLMNNPTMADSVTYVDAATDSSILGNQLLYTTGGVVENIAFPPVDDTTLYKSRLVMIDAEDKNLLWFSKQVIATTPVEPTDLFTVYVAPSAGAQGSTGPCTAVSIMDDKLVIFKRNAIYYMTGEGPDNTGANNDFSQPTYINTTAGCTNPRSIVYTPQGLMYQSDKGIWILSRDLNTTYIGAPVEKYNDATVLSAVNVPGTNQVRFTLDNGVTLMYDYFFGQWGTFEGIPGIASTLYGNLHTYVNDLGAVYQETPGLYLDGSAPINMRFTTGWLALMGLQGFQRAYCFYLLGTYITPHKLSVGIAYDYSPSIQQQALISPTNYNPAYGSDAGPYGSGDPYGGQGDVEQHRVFMDTQQCQAFQITVTESFDPSYGTVAGAGLTLSGINLVVGAKKTYTPISAANSGS